MFLDMMRKKVRGQHMRVVYPEGLEERAIRAAVLLRDEDWAKPILLGNEAEISKRAAGWGLDLNEITICDFHNDPSFSDYVETYFQLRQHKGISRQFAQDKVSLPHYFGALMVRKGAADGMVSGLNSETKPFIPAFEIIKLKEGFRRASSLFVLEWPERLLFLPIAP